MDSPPDLPELPSDIILDEILTRTSAKTVAKTRTLCKRWNEHSHESSFAARSARNSKMVSGFFFQVKNYYSHDLSSRFVSTSDTESSSSDRSLSDFSFIPRKERYWHQNVEIIAAAKQGLLLLARDTSKARVQEFIVCKPTTKQWRKIPSPKTRFFPRQVAMTVVSAASSTSSNPREFRFKIARFSEPKNSVLWSKEGFLRGTLNLEIFDSRNWSWRLHPAPVLLQVSEFLDLHNSMVSVSGFAYVLTTKRRLFALDWETETWTLHNLPEPLGNTSTSQLVEHQGKLGIVYIAPDSKDMEIWVMGCHPSKNKVSEWNRQKRVSLTLISNQQPHTCFYYPMAMACSDMVVMSDSFRLYFYNFKESHTVVTFSDADVYPHHRARGYFKIESDDEPFDFASSKIKKTTTTSLTRKIFNYTTYFMIPLFAIFLLSKHFF